MVPGQTSSNISLGKMRSTYKDTQLSSIGYQSVAPSRVSYTKKDLLQSLQGLRMVSGVIPLISENKQKLIHALNQIRDTRVISQLRSRVRRNSQDLGDSNILGKDYWSNLYLYKILWNPVTATPPLFQLPEQLRIKLQSRQHFKSGRRMIRSSPENEHSLANVMNPDSLKRKNLTLDEQFNHSYLIDNSFLLLFCLLTGFNVWWAYLPMDLVECYNINTLNVDIIHPLKVMLIDTHKVTQDLVITDEVREAVTQHLEEMQQIKADLQRLQADSQRLLHPDFDPLNIPKDSVREIIRNMEQSELEPEVEQPRWGKKLAVLMGVLS